MRRTAAGPTVVLLSTRGALAGVGSRLARGGVRVVRIPSAETRPILPARWLPLLLRATGPDTVIVTSPAAVGAGVEPWRRSSAPRAPRLEHWAAGPTTARALRSLGIRRVRSARGLGATPLLRALGAHPRRTVLYLRSDLAGPSLARRLRRQGHRVLEVVAYRTTRPPELSARARRDLLSADLLVVTSPSGIESLVHRLSAGDRVRLQRTARLIVLGARSRRAARTHGFRSVSVAPSPDPGRFTRYLLGRMPHAAR